MTNLDDICRFCVELIGKELPATVVKTWFNDIKLLRLDDDAAYFCTSIPFKRDMLLKYREHLKKALFEIIGQDVQVILDVEQLSEPHHSSEGSLSGGTKSFTFDNFILGESNRYAAAAALNAARDPGNKNNNPLLIYGGSGLGKTHLLHAIKNESEKLRPDVNIVLCSSETFCNDLVSAIQNNTTDDFRKRYRTGSVLLIDDIQFISRRSESTHEELFHTFNDMYNAGRQIVFISDRIPSKIPNLSERLMTRLGWGVMMDIQQPDLETRMAIIRSKAQKSGLKLGNDVAEYLAENITKNVRDLESGVRNLMARHRLFDTPIELEEARRVINEFLEQNPGFNPTPETVIEGVSSFYGVSKEDILSKNRSKQLVKARQIAMYITRKITDKSLTDIGQQVFNKDHSTILYACNKIENDMKTDENLSNEVKTIMENIQNV